MPTGQPCLEIFAHCVEAIRANKLIRRESRQDKEFHFQNWFKARLGNTRLHLRPAGETHIQISGWLLRPTVLK